MDGQFWQGRPPNSELENTYKYLQKPRTTLLLTISKSAQVSSQFVWEPFWYRSNLWVFTHSPSSNSNVFAHPCAWYLALGSPATICSNIISIDWNYSQDFSHRSFWAQSTCSTMELQSSSGLYNWNRILLFYSTFIIHPFFCHETQCNVSRLTVVSNGGCD